MKRKFISLIIIIFIVLGISCARLPKINPPPGPSLDPALDPSDPSFDKSGALKIESECALPFVKNKWQLVHSIKATLPDGKRETLIGTIIVSPDEKTIHSVLTTIEGIVLIEAFYDSTKLKLIRGD